MKQPNKEKGLHEQHCCLQHSLPQKTLVCNRECLASPATLKTFGRKALLLFHNRVLETTSYATAASLHHRLEKLPEQGHPSPAQLPQYLSECNGGAHPQLNPTAFTLSRHPVSRGLPTKDGHHHAGACWHRAGGSQGQVSHIHLCEQAQPCFVQLG